MDIPTPITTTAIEQPGLKWDYDQLFLGPQPTWAVVPDVDVIRMIVQRELALPGNTQCEIEFLAEGSFNKAYTVKCKNKETAEVTYIMRVALPVHPNLRTLSEFATIEFVKGATDLPLPKVLAYEASFVNELGFEWMIQELVPGRQLGSRWHRMSWLKKELLVRKVITYLSQLFQKRFDRIGSIYKTPEGQKTSSSEGLSVHQYELGEVVSFQFFLGDRLRHNVSRGPFKSSREWLAARLQLSINDSEKILADPDLEKTEDNYDFVAANVANRLATKLLALLPKVIPDTEEDNFILHNDDMNAQNILVDADGELTGVIDWECIHTAPIWVACQLPHFLRRPERHEVPIASTYMYKEDGDDEEQLDEKYWDDLEEYEKTILRKFFLEEMSRVLPEWVQVFKENELKADFELAVKHVDNTFVSPSVNDWIEEVEQDKEPQSLKDNIWV